MTEVPRNIQITHQECLSFKGLRSFTKSEVQNLIHTLRRCVGFSRRPTKSPPQPTPDQGRNGEKTHRNPFSEEEKPGTKGTHTSFDEQSLLQTHRTDKVQEL